MESFMATEEIQGYQVLVSVCGISAYKEKVLSILRLPRLPIYKSKLRYTKVSGRSFATLNWMRKFLIWLLLSDRTSAHSGHQRFRVDRLNILSALHDSGGSFTFKLLCRTFDYFTVPTQRISTVTASACLVLAAKHPVMRSRDLGEAGDGHAIWVNSKFQNWLPKDSTAFSRWDCGAANVELGWRHSCIFWTR